MSKIIKVEDSKQDIPKIILETDRDKPGGFVGIDSEGEMNLPNNRLLNSNKAKTPAVVFLSDDGKSEDHSKLKPLADAGAPMTLAIISGKIGQQNYMSAAQIAQMAAAGCEIVGHSVSHVSHVNYDKATADAEVHGCVNTLRGLGYPCKHYVYPFGAYNNTVLKSVSEVCESGLKVGGGINTGSLSTFKLNRVALGSFAGINNTLAYYKSQVDLAKSENALLIFILHPWSPEHDLTQQRHLEDTVSYCKAQGVEIMTLSKALEIHKNILDQLPNSDGGDQFSVSGSGEVRASAMEYNSLDKTVIKAASPLSSFPYGQSESSYIYADNAGFPENEAGKLINYRSRMLGESHQEFRVYNSNNVWRRGTDGSNNWLQWNMAGITYLKNHTKTNASPMADYPLGVSIMVQSGLPYGGFPTNNGTLETVIVSRERGFPFQRWTEYNTGKSHIRFFNTNRVWSPWQAQGDGLLPLNSRGLTGAGSDPASWSIGTTYVKHSYTSTHGLPGTAGTLKVERPTDEGGYSRAWFYKYASHETYVAYALANNSWSGWKKVTLV